MDGIRSFKSDKSATGPPGWRVESRPRTSEKYKGKIDWFFYEPGTKKRFRSVKSAWARYMEIKQNEPMVVAEGMTRGGLMEGPEQIPPAQCSEPIMAEPPLVRRPKLKKHARMKVTMKRKPNMKKLARMKMETANFDFAETPEPITWVLSEVEGNKWTAYDGDEMVSEMEKKLWDETFQLSMLWTNWPSVGGSN